MLRCSLLKNWCKLQSPWLFRQIYPSVTLLRASKRVNWVSYMNERLVVQKVLFDSKKIQIQDKRVSPLLPCGLRIPPEQAPWHAWSLLPASSLRLPLKGPGLFFNTKMCRKSIRWSRPHLIANMEGRHSKYYSWEFFFTHQYENHFQITRIIHSLWSKGHWPST